MERVPLSALPGFAHVQQPTIARVRRPCGVSPAWRMTATISSTVDGRRSAVGGRRIGGILQPLVARWATAMKPGIVAGERRRPAAYLEARWRPLDSDVRLATVNFDGRRKAEGGLAPLHAKNAGRAGGAGSRGACPMHSRLITSGGPRRSSNPGGMRFATTATLVVVVAILRVLGAPPMADAKLIECQHSVRTGVEVFRLYDVGKQTACRIALNLYSYGTSGHIIVECIDETRPVLRLKRFDGWSLSLRGGFHLHRGGSRFAVTGTDFPAPCG